MTARWAAICLLVHPLFGSILSAQEGDQPADDGQLMARFETILKENPRRGTALDRVYGHHARSGTLDELIARWRQRAEADDRSGPAWMLVGLFESRRGNDAEAIEAFRRAEDADDQNPYASFYLAESLRLVGQLPEAAEAYRRAIARRPPRAELLNTYRQLGRTLQRSGRESDALTVWRELEAQFLGDARVAEQIAAALAEDGNFEEARRRYAALAEATQQDLYRQVTYQIQAADLTRQLGEQDEAIAQFEQILSRLNPDSWLFDQVREKIESVFRNADDLAGLADYYTDWLDAHADDLDAMAKLAKVLSTLGRSDDAAAWYARAIKLAPSQTAIRQAYIDQLVYDKKHDEAAEQYRQLNEIDPNNPDVIQQWGLVLLNDGSVPEDERREAATDVWMQLVRARADDAVVVVQVADLLRQAQAYEKAEQLYRRAVALRPRDVQYHEYLGEFLHARGRNEEAVAAWNKSVEGELRTPENLYRLAEVFRGFGYLKEALATADDARQAEPEEIRYHLTYIDLLLADDRFDDAKAAIAKAEPAANDFEDRENLLEREIRAHEGAGTMADAIADTRGKLEPTSEPTPQTAALWLRLARFLDADRQRDEAIGAVETAVQIDPTSIGGYRLLADFKASIGALDEAAEAYRRLATIDAQFRSNYLREIARVEARLGRIDEALQAGQDLLAAAPGNADSFQFYADLCFQLGRSEEGLETLRRAVRTDPSDADQLLRLAGALANQFQTAEAIELYWQAFDKSEDLRDKLSVVSRLADLHIQQNQFERLINRLEREGRQAGSERTAAFCVAQAHLQAEDYYSARNKLVSYLAGNEQDTLLLEQLSRIAEQEGDLDSAIDYQEQLVAIKKEEREKRKLAQLLLKSNQADQAETLLAELALQQDELHRILDSADELLTFERFEAAEQIIGELAERHPQNWEVLYRQGVAAAGQDDAAGAAQRFLRLLDLSLDHDETSAAAKARAAMQAGGGRRASSYQPTASTDQTSPLIQRVQRHYEVRREILDDPRIYSSSRQFRKMWTPSDFGMARMAALAWLVKLAEETDNPELRHQLDQQYKLAQGAADAPTHLQDALYFALVTSNLDAQLDIARRLSQTDEVAGAQLYLMKMMENAQRNGRIATRGEVVQAAEPLPNDRLDYLLASYRRLEAAGASSLVSYLMLVVSELEHSGRQSEAEDLLHAALAKISEARQALQLTSLFLSRGDIDGVVEMIRLARSLPEDGRSTVGQSSRASLSTTLAMLFSKLANEEKLDEILDILVVYLDWAEADRVAEHQSYRRSTGGQAGARPNRVYMYSGRGYRIVQLDFPPPTDSFDEGSVNALRNAFEYLRQHDALDRLASRIAEQADPANVTLQLASAYIDWWRGDQAAAADGLRAAVEATGGDEDLRFQLAQALLSAGDLSAALEELDQITALDQTSTIRRETAVLGLALQTGKIERARQAAERLFGLRLDSNQQLQLAQSMHQLGMHEMADAVLRRMRQTSRGASNDLVNLMSTYQQQGKKEEALQIAHQILRSRPTSQQSGNLQESHRQRALQTIARLGNLKQLIADTEGELEKSPNSARLLRQLADYYRADKQHEKAQKVYERLAELGPDDARSRLQAGRMLEEAGNPSGAVDQYLAAFQLDPSLFDQNWYQIQRTFERQKKMPQLAKVLLESDLTKLSRPHYVINFLQRLVQNSEYSEIALDLFDKLWEAHPQYRTSMLTSLRYDAIRKSDRVYQYAREGVLDDSVSGRAAPWQAIERIISWSSDGTITSAPSILLDVAEAQNKLDSMESEIRQMLADRDDWPAGEAMLGLIALRRGEVDQAKAIFDRLFEERLDEAPAYASMILGDALEKEPSLRPWAARLYEQCIKDAQRTSGLGYEISPEKRLVNLYKVEGRRREAFDLLFRIANSPIESRNNPEYDAYQWLRRQAGIGAELVELGYPLDALHVVNTARNDTAKLQAAARYGGRMEQDFDRTAQVAQNELTPSTLVEYLIRSSGPIEGAPPEPKDRRKQAGGATSEKSHAGIALLLYTKSDNDNQQTVASPMDELIGGLKPGERALAEMASRLVAMARDERANLSVHVIWALAELRMHAEDEGKTELPSLNRLLDAVQAVELPSGRREQRLTETDRGRVREQLGLWLVARKCLGNADRAEAGRVLARRAVAAASLLDEDDLMTSMLRESGKLAIERGDVETAQRQFQTLLDALLGTDVESPERIEPVDIEAFQQIVSLAELAATNDMHALSLECIRKALRGGPPIPAVASELAMQSIGASGAASGTLVVTKINLSTIGPLPASGQIGQERQAVAEALTRLDDLWTREGVPADRVYDTLAVAVLPAGRRNEVFLYAAAGGPSGSGGRPNASPRPQNIVQALFGFNKSRPHVSMPDGAALRLIRRAIDAQKVDDLRQRVVKRSAQPLAALPAQVLLAQLAMEVGDADRATAALDWLAKRLAYDRQPHTIHLAGLAAVPALKTEEHLAAGVALAEQIAAAAESQNDQATAQQMRALLTEAHAARENQRTAD